MSIRSRETLSLVMAARVIAGLVSVLPPVLALWLLDRSQYGRAISDIALALILCGPITQYIGQGYLRAALKAEHHGGTRHFPGAAIVHLWGLGAVFAGGAAAILGFLQTADAVVVAAFVPVYLANRVLESQLVARSRQLAAVILVYVLPPIFTSTLIVLLTRLGALGDFASVAASVILAYAATVYLGLVHERSFAQRLAPPPLPRGWSAWREETRAVAAFLTHGALLGAAEQVPVVALRLIGASAVIPSFELARKVASLPGVIIHALSMHLVPRMVGAAERHDLADLRRLAMRATGGMTAFAMLYAGAAAASVAVLQAMGPIADALPFSLLTPLLLTSVVIAAGSGFGAASLALRGERWWVRGAALGLLLQVIVIVVGAPFIGPAAIAWASFALMTAFHATVVLGVAAALWSEPAKGPMRAEDAAGHL
jgi:hypothetical protein